MRKASAGGDLIYREMNGSPSAGLVACFRHPDPIDLGAGHRHPALGEPFAYQR